MAMTTILVINGLMKDRFLILKKLYDSTKGKKSEERNIEQYGRDINVRDAAFEVVWNFLLKKGLIAPIKTRENGWCTITEEGADAIESAYHSPEEKTKYFPSLKEMEINF